MKEQKGDSGVTTLCGSSTTTEYSRETVICSREVLAERSFGDRYELPGECKGPTVSVGGNKARLLVRVDLI